MKKVILVSLFIVFLFITSASVTQSCIGARAAGMGHAGVASSNDATVVYWNPAMLPWIRSGLSLGITRPLEYDHIVFSYNNFGFLYVDEYWGPYTHFSIGHQLTPNLSVGCSIGLGLDVDDIWKPYISPAIAWKNNNITFGILLQTMNNLRPAISYSNNYWSFAVEYYDILDRHKVRRLRLGQEFRYKSNVFLRCGAEITANKVIKNAGLGYETKNINFDISYDTQAKWTVSATHVF